MSGKWRSSGVVAIGCNTTTSSFIGRVGFQRRQGNISLLSFGPTQADVANDDSPQLLSALLPFVVAATAVAALAKPSTFIWYAFFISSSFELLC